VFKGGGVIDVAPEDIILGVELNEISPFDLFCTERSAPKGFIPEAICFQHPSHKDVVAAFYTPPGSAMLRTWFRLGEQRVVLTTDWATEEEVQKLKERK
jgi:hypothetical protein